MGGDMIGGFMPGNDDMMGSFMPMSPAPTGTTTADATGLDSTSTTLGTGGTFMGDDMMGGSFMPGSESGGISSFLPGTTSTTPPSSETLLPSDTADTFDAPND